MSVSGELRRMSGPTCFVVAFRHPDVYLKCVWSVNVKSENVQPTHEHVGSTFLHVGPEQLFKYITTGAVVSDIKMFAPDWIYKDL